MGVPPASSAGPQMWIRGPAAQQNAQQPAGQNAQQAAQQPVAQAAPAAAVAPAAALRAVPSAPAVPVAPSAPVAPVAPAEREPSPHVGQRFAWVNAHGGGGASTLAQALGGADLGTRWPEPAEGEPGDVLLVARTHAGGIRAASQALNALRMGDHPDGLRLVAVVLVADAPGRLPRQLGQRVRVLRSAAEVHRVPWVPAWRLGEEVDPLPRDVRALASLVAGPAGPMAGVR
ncbi:hypothetical protein [Streptomyces sp. NPDC006645]|uniref:hypothetical protein n=1 Tax=unclassified Streptomyces TaxID=2593676 RepID=UPI0033BEA6D8